MGRPSDRVYRAVFAVVFVAVGAVVGHGVTVMTAPEPVTITETVMLDAPPACREIAPEVQAERARVEHLAEARENVQHAAADLAEVTLSADPDAIIRSAEILDTARRDEQQTRLDLATAHVTTDAVVADCAPERER